MAQPKNGDIEQLLPWYVNGTLSTDEETLVRDYVQENTGAARDVEMLRHVQDAVRSEEYGSPGEFGRRRLRASLSKEESSEERESGLRWWKPAMAAATLVIVVQGGFLFDLWQRPDGYQPAGVSGGASTIQVQFAPDATEQQIRSLLNELDVEIVSGPGGIGVYRVAPVQKDIDPENLVERLRASDAVVSFAEVD